MERAEVAVAKRREALMKAEDARAVAEIIASVDGFIIERQVAVGKRVAAGALLFVIGDATIIRLRAKASGDGALAIAPGAEATLTSAAAPDRTFLGRVIEVRRPTAPEEGATVDVVIEAENPDLALRPGMEASARIEIDEREAACARPRSDLQSRQRQVHLTWREIVPPD